MRSFARCSPEQRARMWNGLRYLGQMWLGRPGHECVCVYMCSLCVQMCVCVQDPRVQKSHCCLSVINDALAWSGLVLRQTGSDWTPGRAHTLVPTTQTPPPNKYPAQPETVNLQGERPSALSGVPKTNSIWCLGAKVVCLHQDWIKAAVNVWLFFK